MTRGESQRHIAGAPVAGMDVQAAMVVDEAERIAAEAASAAAVDAAYRRADRIAAKHHARFGFQYPELRA